MMAESFQRFALRSRHGVLGWPAAWRAVLQADRPSRHTPDCTPCASPACMALGSNFLPWCGSLLNDLDILYEFNTNRDCDTTMAVLQQGEGMQPRFSLCRRRNACGYTRVLLAISCQSSLLLVLVSVANLVEA